MSTNEEFLAEDDEIDVEEPDQDGDGAADGESASPAGHRDAVDGEVPAGDATSLDEILSNRAEDRSPALEEDDEDSLLAFDGDERAEPLSVRVVPQQPTEFMCRKCYLVKHRSQLADRRRMLCRDCA